MGGHGPSCPAAEVGELSDTDDSRTWVPHLGIEGAVGPEWARKELLDAHLRSLRQRLTWAICRLVVMMMISV